MLPGKKYSPEDVLKILRKRIWFVVLPWAVVAAATAVAARKLPDRYSSMALIQFAPPQVPDNIVRPVNSVRFQDRLQAVQQSILSRSRLEGIINEFNLYADERRNGGLIMQWAVERMRNDIRVTPDKGETFTVAYEGRDPVTVQKVAERLAAYFKEESVKDGEDRAERTNSFVNSQVEAAKQKLLEVEERLKEYKMRFSGELPAQQNSNGTALATIQVQMGGINRSIDADLVSKATLEREIATLEAHQEAPVMLAPSANQPANTVAAKLAAAHAELNNMLNVRGLREEHFEVRAMRRNIAQLHKDAEAEGNKVTVGAITTNPVEQARLATLAKLRDQLEQVNNRIALSKNEIIRLSAQAANYQAKLDRAPVHDAELMELTRDYNTYTAIYNDLVGKREQTSMSVNLERRQIGGQYVLLDPARLPEAPFSPNRILINLFGILGGLALGLGIVALLEYRDGSFKADYEVASVLAMPVLAVVPVMRSESERRRDFRRKLVLNLGLASTVCVCLAVLAYTFVR